MTNSGAHYRRSIRLREYEYSQTGLYFITLCTQNRKYLFGSIANGSMVLNKFGKTAHDIWLAMPNHFPYVQLDEFVVMPNHIHGIIAINVNVGARHAVPLQREGFGKPVAGSISTIVRSYKSAVTKRINEMRKTPGTKIWQRNYWEHVIRNEKELYRLQEYIQNNPARWQFDHLHGYDAMHPGETHEPSCTATPMGYGKPIGHTPSRGHGNIDWA